MSSDWSPYPDDKPEPFESADEIDQLREELRRCTDENAWLLEELEHYKAIERGEERE